MVDRNEKGQFVAGWKGGPGRPKRLVEQEYLAATLARIPLDKWQKVVDKALSQAIAGDYAARQWLSDHVLGKPTQRQEFVNGDDEKIVIAVVKMSMDEL